MSDFQESRHIYVSHYTETDSGLSAHGGLVVLGHKGQAIAIDESAFLNLITDYLDARKMQGPFETA